MSYVDRAVTMLEKLVAWVTRKRSIGLLLIGAASSVIIGIASGGFALQVTGGGIVESVQFKTGDGLPGHLLTLVTWVCVLILLGGIWLIISEYRRERKEAEISKVIVIELRGLVDTSDRPLKNSIPRRLVGHKHDCLVDIRRQVANGPVSQREASEAIRELEQIQRSVRQERGGTAREHVSVVAGGVMQVPFLFYAGSLLDDEGQVTLLDWERTASEWRELTEPDNNERFSVSGMASMDGNTVVLAVSATYRASDKDIAATFPGVRVVQLALANPTPNKLFSEVTQAALTQQFIGTLAELANAGVQQVHLVLVASASLSLRFGRAYDARNMPVLLCYHRDNTTPPYPWSIQMPSAGQAALYVKTALDDTTAST